MASKIPIRRMLRIPDEIVALIRGCHPQLKGKIRAGLRNIMVEPESGKALKDDLDGLWSYRISRFRIMLSMNYHLSSELIPTDGYRSASRYHASCRMMLGRIKTASSVLVC
jgi:mRNA interferase RelE/StbE